MTFSQRMKLVPVRESIQIESLDAETRAAIWNVLLPFICAIQNEHPSKIARSIWMGLYKKPADIVPPLRKNSFEDVSDEELYCRFFRSKVMDGKWHECFDFIEHIASEERRSRWNRRLYDYHSSSQKAYVPDATEFNAIFEKYMVGYRFVNGLITRVTTESEIVSIEGAIGNSQPSVGEQLSKALVHFSDRAKPDYAKSVECSISAVEAQCCILLCDEKVTLGDALSRLEKSGIRLHPALKGALSKLYGFTSDEAGIRHGSIQPSDVDKDIARFMLVTCSAFVNYLISKGK